MPKFKKNLNPQVFLEISIDGRPAERITFELFADVVPKTAENFRALCTGKMQESLLWNSVMQLVMNTHFLYASS
ncbi:unnamed protein product [Triticum turgidum subsp. durum]|uniref:PPIase cyclophilin-type domain-containing protein n=1 Tax=Triticum turgidum subsp. durum TaxID=4567 RepID=A0A9R1PNL8_TRITD|nr:unnamed protein product [Triticum turgidum subsp. durum]